MMLPQVAQDSAEVRMREMLGGYRITQMLYVAAKLGLPDLLAEGPKTAEELANAANAHGSSLYRLLRALASMGVFAERSDGTFESTPLADRLRSDIPGSQRAFALSYGEPWWWNAFGELLHSVKTGETAFSRVHGTTLFEYLGRHPDAARVFNDNMTAATHGLAEALAAAYDFSQVKVLVDVGGGHGALAAALLRRNPLMRAVILDQAGVLEGAAPVLQESGILARCDLSPGDFFQAVPDGGDIYMLSAIIHDWDDVRAAAILKGVRRAMRPDAKLLVIESMIPPGNEPFRGKLVDLTMMVFTGGRERTEPEHRQLLHDAGLRLNRVISLSGASVLLEALPV
ncbi:MAG TPA: methyltransferase [Terriglobales bacterium]|nr:methyltransferase [Terriglobales bacterium]